MAGLFQPQKENPAATPAKEAGNQCFQAGKFEEAVQHFTEAIRIDPSSAVLKSNRAGAYASMGKHWEALSDADMCISVQPEWWKGYSRRGHALFSLGRFAESVTAFEQAMRMNPSDPKTVEALAGARAKQAQAAAEAAALAAHKAAQAGAAAGEATTGSGDPLRDAAAAAVAPGAGKPPAKPVEAPEEPLSKGDRLLDRRRRWLEEWDNWDESRLHARLRNQFRLDADGFKREELIEVLLLAETEQYQNGRISQKTIQLMGLAATALILLATFGGVVVMAMTTESEPA